jgi:hypothetical protein
MKRRFVSGIFMASVIALAACQGGTGPSPAPGRLLPNAAPAISCYGGDNGTPASVSDTVTFYGWPDNTPPGAAIAHPVIHATAGGDGSYCDPTTFATEPTKAENARIPYGTRIYVPAVDKYFIREDDCTKSGFQHLGCAGIWTDLWIGGDKASKRKAVIHCENAITPDGKVTIVLHPGPDEAVNWLGPIYSDATGCDNG